MPVTHSFFKRNGLLIVFLGLTALALMTQAYTGFYEHSEERLEKTYRR